MKKITIAIDGFSSYGKSTMTKNLTKEIGYIYVDTGAMCHSVTLYALRHNLFNTDGTIREEELQTQMKDINISFQLNKETKRPETYLNGENVENEIHTMEVSPHVSPIATLTFVHKTPAKQQQHMGAGKGIVMDDRDIGTVIFPNAELKIFVTASAKVHAQRRYDELKTKGMEADFADILGNVQGCDYIDPYHETSPLHRADDALGPDNSQLTIAEQKQWLYNQYLKTAEAQ